MYIRCPECRTSTWAAGTGGEVPECVVCRTCGAQYELAGADTLGTSPEERHARAVEFADRAGVDLATAYSMIFGLIATPRSPDDAPASDEDPDEPQATADAIGYDAGFRNAVVEGLLTAEEARDLGDRDSAAARLAQLHGLTDELAKAVLEKRMPLSEAVRRAPPPPAARPVAKAASGKQKALVAGMGLLVVVALSIYAFDRWTAIESDARAVEERSARPPTQVAEKPATTGPKAPDPAPAAAVKRHPPSPEIVADDEGRLLKVAARSPTAVLFAFCSAAETAGRYSADRVVPGARGSRLGVLRDFDDMERQLAILIRRDPQSGKWVAGNGLDPIVVADLPQPQAATLAGTEE